MFHLHDILNHWLPWKGIMICFLDVVANCNPSIASFAERLPTATNHLHLFYPTLRYREGRLSGTTLEGLAEEEELH
jgi:hypothetical protein